MKCPIKSSKEWKDTLKKHNGNIDRALEAWYNDPELGDDPSLNETVDEENFEKERLGNIDQEEDETELDPMTKLVKKVELYLSKQIDELGRRKLKNQEVITKRYNDLLEEITTVQGIDSILIFINDAYNNAQRVEKRFNKLQNKINKKEISRQDAIDELIAINDFATGYSILDEISKPDIRLILDEAQKEADELKEPEEGKEKPPITPLLQLREAILVRDQVKKDFVNIGIPLMADFLGDYTPKMDKKGIELIEAKRLQIDKVKKSKATDKYKAKEIERLENEIAVVQGADFDKRNLIKVLTEANADTGVIDFLLSPLISSEDAALGLFAKAIKSQLETARMKSLDLKQKVAKNFTEYAESSGLNRDNKSKFNEGIYEILTKKVYNKETGTFDEIQIAAFVQKFDMKRYYQAYDQFKTENPEPPAEQREKYKKFLAKRSAWYRENKQPLPKVERDKIIAEKKSQLDRGLITQDEYDNWQKSVMYPNMDGTITYMRELSQPADKYVNDKWLTMYNMDGTPKNVKGKYHKFLLDTYLESQEKIPESQRLGYVLPSIPKTELERVGTSSLKDTVVFEARDMFSVQAYDTMYGTATLSDEGLKFIPIRYTSTMSADDVSKDLARSVLMFAAMANNYEAINDVYSEVKMFKQVIGNRKVLATNSKGQPIIDEFAKRLGMTEFIRQNGQSYSEMHVNAFIDMVVYGEMQQAEQIFGISADKLTNKITGFSAITTIAADILKGVANNLQGNIQMIIEANAAEFFTRKNLRIGKGFFAKGIPGLLSDFGKPTPESLMGQLIEYYDALQGDFMDNFGNKVTASVAAKLFRTDTLFFNQHFGEIEIQTSAMAALMDNTMVKDNATGEEITLLEAHKKYGTSGVLENTNFTEQDRQRFQNRLHALSKRMHGVYNDFDKGTAQRYSLGRLGTMYRKHLVPGYKRRFKNLSYDQELEGFTEGYYRTFWNLYLKQLAKFKFDLVARWSTLDSFQKSQVKRVIGEATIIASLVTLILILTAMGDDDEDLKKNYMYNFILYEAIRMRSETSSYISPMDAYRVVKSPSAATGTLERLIRFIDQLVLTWDPEKLSYQRKTGVWDQGDNKSWAYFLKLIGLSGYNITPEEAIKGFKGSINR